MTRLPQPPRRRDPPESQLSENPLSPDQLGVIAVTLALNFPDWLRRRVEHVTYLDDVTVKWSEGVMLRWPEPGFFPSGAQPSPGKLVYVPLDLLTKGPVTALDGTRPDGSPFPILPYTETTKLGAAGITSLIFGLSPAPAPGGERLTLESVKLIDAIVRAHPRLAGELLRVLDSPRTELGGLIGKHPLGALLRELGANVMLLAPAVYQPGGEVVYRYSYCRAVPWARQHASLRVGFGFKDLIVGLEDLPLGWSASYHVEIDCPPEILLPCARLYAKYASRDDWVLVAEDGDSPVVDLHARRPTAELLQVGHDAWPQLRPPILPAAGPGGGVPAQLGLAARSEPSAVEQSDVGYAIVRFRPDPGATFQAITAVAALTALLLIASRLRFEQLDGVASGAILLALPIVALGLLSRPGEHAFASRILRPIRAAGLGVGACSLVFAFLLAGGFIHHRNAVAAHACLTTVPGAPAQEVQPSCKPSPARPARTQTPVGIGLLADAATTLAGLLALVLVLGRWSSARRASGRLPQTARTTLLADRDRELTPP